MRWDLKCEGKVRIEGSNFCEALQQERVGLLLNLKTRGEMGAKF